MSNILKRKEKQLKKIKDAQEAYNQSNKRLEKLAYIREFIRMSGAMIAMIIFIAAILINIFWLKLLVFAIGCAVAVPYIKDRFFSK